ncbi:MAG: DUF523 domain-containing protein [Desulfobacteraceae bacterium]|nr:MAG: DUF523 domain-containing protein [Desulfobacteraceae bacterium]
MMISACLTGQKVRYNGSDLMLNAPAFTQILEHSEVIPYCPEVAGGLPTPRIPAEIFQGRGEDVLAGRARVLGADGSDVTEYFIRGAQQALAICLARGIRVALLTESSPSCGSSRVYNGRFEGVKIPGSGVTASLLRKNGVYVFSQHQLEEVFHEIRGYNTSDSKMKQNI